MKTGKLISWAHWQATENWAASLDKNGWGLGVWNPGVQEFSGGFYGDKNSFSTGSKDAPTCYIAPNYREILDYNIGYEYRYVLIVGTLKEIRTYMYDHAKQKARLPSYIFSHDRQHWVYQHTTDTGWPVKGYIKIWLHDNAALVSPRTFGKQNKHLIFISTQPIIPMQIKVVFIGTFDGKDYSSEQSAEFNIRHDGRFHEYKIALKELPSYKGYITGLKIVPAEGSRQHNDWVKVKSIRLGE